MFELPMDPIVMEISNTRISKNVQCQGGISHILRIIQRLYLPTRANFLRKSQGVTVATWSAGEVGDSGIFRSVQDKRTSTGERSRRQRINSFWNLPSAIFSFDIFQSANGSGS